MKFLLIPIILILAFFIRFPLGILELIFKKIGELGLIIEDIFTHYLNPFSSFLIRNFLGK